ncbi:hypothetical protein [Pseudanabaena sp. Chao 1811]|uniref:hypothetical protein n=1 Tax=Pseudanabaena sp. Chao 1811 TaxID=2963092 RepID=UPI0022F39D12|nr:hypothetical protein [Pseudanabaena sp. Chao 1811]
MEPEQDKTIPLSHAYSKRREIRIETSPTELEQILTRVVNKEVTKKIVRLEKSIDRMVSQFQAIQSGESEDAALRVTTDLESADIALASVQIKSEDYYTHTCGMIAEKFSISKNQVLNLIKKLELRGNSSYHKQFQTGAKSFVHKYSEEALAKIKKEIDC